MLADERRLEEERVPLGIDGDEVDVRDPPDQRDLLRPDQDGSLEVRPDPLVEPLRLPDVEHAAVVSRNT